MNLSGKNVVYVGGFGGIGFACCTEMITKGINHLVILDLKVDVGKLQQLKSINAETKIDFEPLNLLDGKEAITKTLQKVLQLLGRIDVLVNGSGIIRDRDAKLTIDINLTGLIETTLAAVPLMSKSHGGHGGMIVQIASVLGLEPGPFAAVYSATKHGVIGFTRALADPYYYQVTGISHIAICPGATVTGILENFVGVDTFDFSLPLSVHVITAKNQTAEECARNTIEAIGKAQNGSVWISDLGKLQEVQMQKYWSYTF